MPCNQIKLIDSDEFHTVVRRLREFFEGRGFIEVHTQSRLSILAACEDPSTIATFTYDGQVWPLPQTGQMWLEHELLRNPEAPGYFCLSTSYRNEPTPVEGRHDKIFPMFEFECRGSMEDGGKRICAQSLQTKTEELIERSGEAYHDASRGTAGVSKKQPQDCVA